MTTAPRAAAWGASSRDAVAPALKSAIATPAKASGGASRPSISRPGVAQPVADRAVRRERDDLGRREATLLEGAEHFSADHPGGPDDGDDTTHATRVARTARDQGKNGAANAQPAR